MKHIIIGLDGTSNAAYHDIFQTNVYKLGLCLRYVNERNEHQLFYYYSGVGTPTRTSWTGTLDKVAGDSVDFFILQAYINLVLNYEEGDKVYIFGFSRGAVVARALSGLIATSGIVSVDHSWLTKSAWDYFVGSPVAINYQDKRDSPTDKSVHFPAPIDFIGVWDTVPGPLRRNQTIAKFRFEDTRISAHVKSGAHIVSIDETRKSFKPILWRNNTPEDAATVCQIWMPGVHSDIGGGYPNDALSHASLLTMIDIFRDQCPDISWESDWIISEFRYQPNRPGRGIVVNDEWGRWFRNFYLNKQHRSPWAKDVVHPLARQMLDGTYEIKGRVRTYHPKFRGDICDMKVLQLADNSFTKACGFD